MQDLQWLSSCLGVRFGLVKTLLRICRRLSAWTRYIHFPTVSWMPRTYSWGREEPCIISLRMTHRKCVWKTKKYNWRCCNLDIRSCNLFASATRSVARLLTFSVCLVRNECNAFTRTIFNEILAVSSLIQIRDHGKRTSVADLALKVLITCSNLIYT